MSNYTDVGARGFAEIFRKYPRLNNEAGRKHILETIAHFTGRDDAAPTLDLYTLAIENPPSYAVDEPKVGLDYQSGRQQQDVQAAVAAIDQRNREVWVRDILPRYDVKDWEANFKLAVEYSNGELTLAKFEFLIQNTPPGFKLSFGDERADLLAKIKERLYDPHGRRMTESDLRSEMRKYQYMNRMELREVLAKIIDRQTTAAKPLSQIKSEIKPELATRRQAAGVEVHPGRVVLPLEYTTQRLRDPKFPVSEFKRLIRMFGADACNDRLNGRS
jgi:hypothetical protein